MAVEGGSDLVLGTDFTVDYTESTAEKRVAKITFINNDNYEVIAIKDLV